MDGTPDNSYSVRKIMAVLYVLGTFSCASSCWSYVEGKLDRQKSTSPTGSCSLKLPLILLYVIGAFVGLLEWINLIDYEPLLFITSPFFFSKDNQFLTLEYLARSYVIVCYVQQIAVKPFAFCESCLLHSFTENFLKFSLNTSSHVTRSECRTKSQCEDWR